MKGRITSSEADHKVTQWWIALVPEFEVMRAEARRCFDDPLRSHYLIMRKTDYLSRAPSPCPRPINSHFHSVGRSSALQNRHTASMCRTQLRSEELVQFRLKRDERQWVSEQLNSVQKLRICATTLWRDVCQTIPSKEDRCQTMPCLENNKEKLIEVEKSGAKPA